MLKLLLILGPAIAYIFFVVYLNNRKKNKRIKPIDANSTKSKEYNHIENLVERPVTATESNPRFIKTANGYKYNLNYIPPERKPKDEWKFIRITNDDTDKLEAQFFDDKSNIVKTYTVINFKKSSFPKTLDDYKNIELVHEFNLKPDDEDLIIVETGQIDLPTGKIVSTDFINSIDWDEEINDSEDIDLSFFARSVKKGTYKVYNKYLQDGNHYRLAFTTVKFSDKKTVKYIRALIDNKMRMDNLFDDDHYSIYSDNMSNMICDKYYHDIFLSKDEEERSDIALECSKDFWDNQFKTTKHPNYNKKGIYGWHNINRDDFKAFHFWVIHSAGAETSSPCYFGLDENGNETEFIISTLDH